MTKRSKAFEDDSIITGCLKPGLLYLNELIICDVLQTIIQSHCYGFRLTRAMVLASTAGILSLMSRRFTNICLVACLLNAQALNMPKAVRQCE